jgi:hypothetical protein
MSSTWRSDLDSLSFRPAGHSGQCLVHRRAFRTILGFNPTPADCAACYLQQQSAFQAAAAARVVRPIFAADANFHLTSRDILRAGLL